MTGPVSNETQHASRLAALLQRLHQRSQAEVVQRARRQFRGTDDEFEALAEQYQALAPRLRGAFLQTHGLSTEDSELSQDTDLSLAISAQMGQFLLNLALAVRPPRILELGSSCGVSTLYLAEALRRLGGGTVVATERNAAKCAQLRHHVQEAGLATYVDLREGDLTDTLAGLDGPFGIVFMDVWASCYLDTFKRIERHLQPGSVVVTDNMFTAGPELREYIDYIHHNTRYSTTTLDFESGVEFTIVVGAAD